MRGPRSHACTQHVLLIEILLLLIELVKNFLAFLDLYLGIVDEVHLKFLVLCLLVHNGSELPVVERRLKVSHQHFGVDLVQLG